MAEEATTPAGEAQAPQTEQTPTTNTNQPAEATQNEVVKTPNLHGFTEEQLADMAKFYAANGGYDKVKSRLSNPQQQTQEQKSAASSNGQDNNVLSNQQPAQPAPEKKMADGFISPEELMVKRYFDSLAESDKYKNIAKEIKNGNIWKEMEALGIQGVDANNNINVGRITQFLDLKSASVPTAPTPAEVTTTPTVDYIQIDGDIKDMNQALAVYQQSMDAQKKGQPVHPSFNQAKEFINKNWGGAKK